MQQSKHGQYRFSVLMKEMRESSSDEEYLASIMAFVNCVLKGASDLMKRIRLLNEFLGKMVLIVLVGYVCNYHICLIRRCSRLVAALE